MEIYETIPTDNPRYEIRVYVDPDPANPREWGSSPFTMACFHHRYTLGDKHNLTVECAEAILASDKYYVLPLYLYDHSGLTMSTTPFSCPWDSGQVGIIYTPVDNPEISDLTPKQVYRYMRQDVETYDDYLTGAVFGYGVYDLEENESIGSCWGFYGYDHEKSGLFECAREIISALPKQLELFD